MRNAALLLALTLPLFAQETAPAARKITFSNHEIKEVLLVARESALKEEHDEDGMQGGSLPGHLQMLMAAFRSIDDWHDAVILRDHVNEDHKVDVICAPPHATPADYKALRKLVQGLVEYHRDKGLLRLVEQEIADKFFDDAEEAAAGFLDFRIQSDAYTEIAVARWTAGQHDKAIRLFQIAVSAALKMKPMFGEVDQTRERIPGQLSSIAEQQYRAGDQARALELLSRSKVMAQGADGFRGFALSQIAHTQLRLGLLQDARDTAGEIDDEVFRNGVLEEISEQQILDSPAKEATKQILGLADSGVFKAHMLTTLVSKLKERGDAKGAIETLDSAFQLVQEGDAGDIPHPANARDLGFSYRLIAIGYSELEAPHKAATVLHKLSSIKEATSSVLDRHDYLFDLAVGYASLGDFKHAHSSVGEMGDSPNDQACETAGYEDTRHGHAHEAVKWAKGLNDSAARTSVLAGIANAMLDMNEEAGKGPTSQKSVSKTPQAAIPSTP
jgi:tetratricopeptide (TPR) repeat protein